MNGEIRSILEYRRAEGKLDRLPDLAAKLVRLKVDVITTAGIPAVRVAEQATATIPIGVGGAANLVAARRDLRGHSGRTVGASGSER